MISCVFEVFYPKHAEPPQPLDSEPCLTNYSSTTNLVHCTAVSLEQAKELVHKNLPKARYLHVLKIEILDEATRLQTAHVRKLS